MYAVVEFERKECSIVPLLWLTEDQSKCYWPKNITVDVFERMVQSGEHPKPGWSKYKVVKLYNILDYYQEASVYLENVLNENSTTSSSTSENNESGTVQLIKKTVQVNVSESDSDPNEKYSTHSAKKCKLLEPKTHKSIKNGDNLSQDFLRVSEENNGTSSKTHIRIPPVDKDQLLFHKPSSLPRILSPHTTINNETSFSNKKTMPVSKTNKSDKCYENYSPEEFSSEDDTPENITTRRGKTSCRRELLLPKPLCSSKIFLSQISSPQNSSPSRSSISGSITSCSQSEEPTNILDVILRQVEHIRTVQDQLCIKLDNIERNQQTSVIQQLQIPSTMPVLPISSKAAYKNLELFLTDESNALYMRRRLAAVGGSSVRSTVMNILKFVLSNEVAMKFNWSGHRDKRAFKHTAIMSIVNEAVKLSYWGREPSDLTDTCINNAVKDWLKLAKHRYLYSSKKVRVE